MYGLYKGWLQSERGDSSVAFEDFKSRVKKREDFTFVTKGQNGSSEPLFAENITVDPRKPVTIVFVAQPNYGRQPNSPGSIAKATNYQPAAGFQFCFRVIEGDLYVQIFDITAGQVTSKEQTYKPIRFRSSLDVVMALSIININEWKTALERQDIYNPSIPQINELKPERDELSKFLVPEYSAIGQVNGILGVK